MSDKQPTAMSEAEDEEVNDVEFDEVMGGLTPTRQDTEHQPTTKAEQENQHESTVEAEQSSTDEQDVPSPFLRPADRNVNSGTPAYVPPASIGAPSSLATTISAHPPNVMSTVRSPYVANGIKVPPLAHGNPQPSTLANDAPPRPFIPQPNSPRASTPGQHIHIPGLGYALHPPVIRQPYHNLPTTYGAHNRAPVPPDRVTAAANPNQNFQECQPDKKPQVPPARPLPPMLSRPDALPQGHQAARNPQFLPGAQPRPMQQEDQRVRNPQGYPGLPYGHIPLMQRPTGNSQTATGPQPASLLQPPAFPPPNIQTILGRPASIITMVEQASGAQRFSDGFHRVMLLNGYSLIVSDADGYVLDGRTLWFFKWR